MAVISKRGVLFSCVLFWLGRHTDALIQSLSIQVSAGGDDPSTMLASAAFFGSIPSMNPKENPKLVVSMSPDDNHFLCNNVTGSVDTFKNTAMMVPRGICTFERKALRAQQLGASAVIIYGSLDGRYRLNVTGHTDDYEYSEKDIIFPAPREDYDCDYGEADVPKSLLSFDPLPYNAAINNQVLTETCLDRSRTSLDKCPSKACLLTGEERDGHMKACCAWDLPIILYSDNSIKEDLVKIPVAYWTLTQANRVKQKLANSQVSVVISSRWKPEYNPSAALIWALGVFVAALAAYMTADDYRALSEKLLRSRDRRARDESHPERPASTSSSERPPDEVLELSPVHAVGFIVMASSTLLILFYFKIYGIVKIFYALGCSNAVGQVILSPLLVQAMKFGNYRDTVVWRTGTEDFGDIHFSDAASFVIGYILGFTWLVIAYVSRDPDSITYFWVMQDVFGACMCILFLKVIRINSMYVASVLLIVAFFYDIFFVFISPRFFDKSVMITVATSGGPPTEDPLTCEKYPNDAGCQGGNPLPMLLTVPRLFDFEGGSSLLGLGDIVLPGLLVSFGARFDAAKSLVGILNGGSGSLSQHCPEEQFLSFCGLCKGGYFVPLVIAYGIGLLMANMAVYVMEMGQPALLYLVPCCLGTLAFLGWRRGELTDMWNGPKALKTADNMLYGEEESQEGGNMIPVPTDETDDVLAAPPSAVDDDQRT